MVLQPLHHSPYPAVPTTKSLLDVFVRHLGPYLTLGAFFIHRPEQGLPGLDGPVLSASVLHSPHLPLFIQLHPLPRLILLKRASLKHVL